MNNIAIAKETVRITAAGRYEVNGKTVTLPQTDPRETVCISPEEGAALIAAFRKGTEMCRIECTAEDSFEAAHRLGNALVLNFANAHHAGGGFLLGANAQEEALCRCSALFAALSGETAAEMYRYNNTHISRVESDYMLFSPKICVFRDANCNLLEEPFQAAVITAPAPNRRGAALLAPNALLRETFRRRIRIILAAAQKYGYSRLVLGAWGCGAFGNSPDDVSEDFRTVLLDEGYGTAFETVCFAVYGKEDGRNLTAFRRTFKG